MSDREPESVAFERVPLGGGRGGRRFDPVLLGVVAVVIALGAAIVKPWDTANEGGAGAASASHAAASPAAGAATAPASAPPAAAEAILTAPITWPRAAAAIRPHDDWGVRVIVRDPEPPAADDPAGGFVERWSAIDEVSNPVTADRAVLALGLTFPHDTTPLDIRIWRSEPGAGWRWMDTQALEATPSGGAYLFGPPVIDGVQFPVWPSGSYRADVLVGGTVLRKDIVLAGESRTLLGTRADRGEPLGSTFAADLSELQGGAFATVDGVAVPLTSRPGRPLDPAQAWLDVVHDDGSDQSGPVGVGYLPRANGLGVLLDPGASALNATIRRLAPDDGPVLESTRAVGLRFGTEGERAPYVVFRAPGGVAFAPGVYAIDAAWTTTAGGREEATYNVELRPGPERLAPELLEAARVYAPQTGVDALVIAGPDYGTGYGSLISVLPLVTGSSEGAYRDIGCDSASPISLSGRPRVIGLAHAAGAAPEDVQARLLFQGGRELGVPLLLSPDAGPGMSLLAPADAPDFVPGVYGLTLRTDGVDRSVTVCLGAFATTR